MKLSDLLPDSRFPAITDVLARYRFFKSSLLTTHTTLAVNETVSRITEEAQRLVRVQVGAVSGGTVTVQVQVDGRDMFTDAVRPVSGGAVQDATATHVFPAGALVSTIIEATSGAPTGSTGVIIETEPFELIPRAEPVKLEGPDRLKPSARRQARVASAGVKAEPRGLIGPVEGTGRVAPTDSRAARSPAPRVGRYSRPRR